MYCGSPKNTSVEQWHSSFVILETAFVDMNSLPWHHIFNINSSTLVTDIDIYFFLCILLLINGSINLTEYEIHCVMHAWGMY